MIAGYIHNENISNEELNKMTNSQIADVVGGWIVDKSFYITDCMSCNPIFDSNKLYNGRITDYKIITTNKNNMEKQMIIITCVVYVENGVYYFNQVMPFCFDYNSMFTKTLFNLNFPIEKMDFVFADDLIGINVKVKIEYIANRGALITGIFER